VFKHHIKDYNLDKKVWEGKDSCIIASLPLRMLKIPMKTIFASRIILFQEIIKMPFLFAMGSNKCCIRNLESWIAKFGLLLKPSHTH